MDIGNAYNGSMTWTPEPRRSPSRSHGDLATGKAVLRDYINAMISFEALGRATGTPPKSLMRMLGPRSNPQASNLFAVLRHLQKQDGGPPARARRNFTDPDSRLLKTRDGFIQGYNGQLAVDAQRQIIVAQRLTTHASDQAGLVPLVDAARAALGRKPREISADAGFCREDNLAALAARGIRGYLAPGGAAHGAPDPSGRRRLKPGSRMAAMVARLKRAGRRSRYRLRKQTVEPVIGQIKQARGFRQFLLRGFGKAAAEWALICTAHNLTKLIAARRA